MPWTDEQANCILEVCCGKDGKQLKALVEVLRDEAGLPPPMALSAATWLIQTFDFALKGSLLQFKQDIANFARGNAYE